MKIILTLSSLLLLSYNLCAKEILLVTVKSNIEADIIKIIVNADDHNELTHLYSDTYKNGIFNNRKSYDLQDIGDGFVIYQKSGRDVVKLFSNDFTTYAGGEVTMRYLYSGISNEYRNRTFNMVKGDSRWTITDQRDRKIKSFYFRAKKFWGKVIGIKAIDYKY